MNVYVYNAPVDPSYRTGWFRLPYERMLSKFSIPSIPLANEMTLDIPNEEDKSGGFNYVILETDGDARGFFVKDIQVLGNGEARRLHLSVDHWVTGSILNQVQWQGTGATLPNADIATGLFYDRKCFDVPGTVALSLTPPFYQAERGARVVCSVKLRVSNSTNVFYGVLVSTPFTDYTTFQYIVGEIQRAEHVKPTPDLNTVINDLIVDTVESVWCIPAVTFEINRTILQDDESIVFYDVPCVPLAPNATAASYDWTLLGNLLGTRATSSWTAYQQRAMLSIVSPRVVTYRLDYSGLSSNAQTIRIGNPLMYAEYPSGEVVSGILYITLQNGTNPVEVILKLNNQSMNMTNSMAVSLFAIRNSTETSQTALKYAVNGIATAVSGGARIYAGDVLGGISTLSSLVTTSPPTNMIGGTGGSGATSCVINLNGVSTFCSPLCAWYVANQVRELDGSQMYEANSVGYHFSGRVAFNFFYRRPPTNYETIGIFQIDNPRPIPIGYNFSPNVSVGECCEILQRGIYLYAPDNPTVEMNNDGSLNLTDDML